MANNVVPIASLQKFYFTFAQRTNLKHNYVVVEAQSMGDARNKMCDGYGQRWAFSYESEQFLPQIDKYGLTEVEFGVPVYDV